MRVTPRRPLGPGVDLGEALRADEPLMRLAAAIRVLDKLLLDAVEADARHPLMDAFQVMALLAIELEQRAAVFQHLTLCLHLAQQLGLLDVQAAAPPM